MIIVNHLILVIISTVVLLTSNVDSVADKCLEDYDPCVCTEAGYGLVIYCDHVTVDDVLIVFNRTSLVRDLHQIIFTLIPPDQSSQQVVIPENFLSDKRVKSIFFVCLKNLTSYQLTIHRDAFRSSSDYTQQINIEDCDLSQWDYKFMADFSQVSELKLIQSFRIESFKFLPKLPSLRQISFDQCSGLNGLAFPAGSLPGLERLDMANNQLDDVTVESFMRSLSFQSFPSKLQWLDLTENLLTKVPQHIPLFKGLKFLYLQDNDINRLTYGSLSMAGAVSSLFLSRNKITDIEPGAFQGNFSSGSLFLDFNELTRFDSAVFKSILEQMVWQGDGRGQIYIYNNPIECDCNLTWLIRDNRDLLKATGSGFCSNGTRFEELNVDGFEDCDLPPNKSFRNSPDQQIILQVLSIFFLSFMSTL